MSKGDVEVIKADSEGLLGSLLDEFNDASLTHLSEDASQLIKYHGSYQQDDRDLRKQRMAEGLDKAWSFMVRTKTPGGRMTPAQYLVVDDLCDAHGNGTLRITTRQAIQFHGVGKEHLKPLLQGLNDRLVSTYGACGDVARNTLCCPAYDLLPHAAFDVQGLAKEISDRFLPESTSYYELWLDGQKVVEDGVRVDVESKRTEPLYGKTYLPRKYKTAIGVPGDNCVDLFTQDAALEAVVDNGVLRGFNLLAGGGLGHTHGKSETFPRLADRIGFLTPDDVIAVLESTTALYRDNGDRTNRKHARLKYVLEDRGVEWFRDTIATSLGKRLAPPVVLPKPDFHDHIGVTKQHDGRFLVGVWVNCGRLKKDERAALREVVTRFAPEIRFTNQQNILLANIDEHEVDVVLAILKSGGLSTSPPGDSELRRWSMACPAMPTCGLAVAESERWLPTLLGELEALGHKNDRVSIRMSGCPNSCSRPPSSEIGLIGRSLDMYSVHLGGNFSGTRLSRLYKDKVTSAELPTLLSSLLKQWRAERNDDEEFGDWADRAVAAPARVPSTPGLPVLQSA